MTKTILASAVLLLLAAGCCGWPCNWPDPPQPPGTRTVQVYGVLVNEEIFAKIADNEMELNEAAQLWHKNPSTTIYFADAESTADLVFEELDVHFIDECGLFVMTGTGRITFGRTVIDVIDGKVVLQAIDEDGEVVSMTLVTSYWPCEGSNDVVAEAIKEAPESPEAAGEREAEADEAETADGEDYTLSPVVDDGLYSQYNMRGSKEWDYELLELLITRRISLAALRDYKPKVIRGVHDLTVRPDGTWWEGVGFYPGGCP